MKKFKVDKKFIKQVVENNLEELSSTSAVAGYSTPNAFSPNGKKNRATKHIEKIGYHKPKKIKQKALDVIRMFQEMSDDEVVDIIKKFEDEVDAKHVISNRDDEEQGILEISYRKFKQKTDATPKQKVNNALKLMTEMMKEMERTVNNVDKLKTEMGLDSSTVWKSTGRHLEELSKRLNVVSRKVKELSN